MKFPLLFSVNYWIIENLLNWTAKNKNPVAFRQFVIICEKINELNCFGTRKKLFSRQNKYAEKLIKHHFISLPILPARKWNSTVVFTTIGGGNKLLRKLLNVNQCNKCNTIHRLTLISSWNSFPVCDHKYDALSRMYSWFELSFVTYEHEHEHEYDTRNMRIWILHAFV